MHTEGPGNLVYGSYLGFDLFKKLFILETQRERKRESGDGEEQGEGEKQRERDKETPH